VAIFTFSAVEQIPHQVKATILAMQIFSKIRNHEFRLFLPEIVMLALLTQIPPFKQ
jgi:hypothetical protein